MIELLRTTDPVLISAVTALLRAEDIETFVFDVHMSVLEGSIAFLIPRRVMVAEDQGARARHILRLADIEVLEDGA